MLGIITYFSFWNFAREATSSSYLTAFRTVSTSLRNDVHIGLPSNLVFSGRFAFEHKALAANSRGSFNAASIQPVACKCSGSNSVKDIRPNSDRSALTLPLVVTSSMIPENDAKGPPITFTWLPTGNLASVADFSALTSSCLCFRAARVSSNFMLISAE